MRMVRRRYFCIQEEGKETQEELKHCITWSIHPEELKQDGNSSQAFAYMKILEHSSIENGEEEGRKAGLEEGKKKVWKKAL